MHLISRSALLLAAAAAAAIALTACSGGGGDGAAGPTSLPARPTAAPSTYVVDIVKVGCDRPEPGRGTEALALVRVTNANGDPVLGANVYGRIEGPSVVLSEATDATTDTGEASMFFVVDANGDYTITVTRVTGPRGRDAILDPASTLAATNTVGDVCEWP